MKRETALLKGVIPNTEIDRLIKTDRIKYATIANIQAASLDLQLDMSVMYELEYLTFPRKTETVEGLISILLAERIAKKHSTPIIYPGKRYMIRLKEEIQDLPYGGRANPKSSTGRVFNYCRLLCDGEGELNVIPMGYRGGLWVIITPQFFPIRLCESEPLVQARFFSGDARLTETELRRVLRKQPDLAHYPHDLFTQPIEDIAGDSIGELTLTADLKNPCYKTKKPLQESNVLELRSNIIKAPVVTEQQPLDLSRRDSAFTDYFELIDPDKMKKGLILEEGYGYLLPSFELFHIPDDLAAEVITSDKFGDIKAHFAGFVDPGFGPRNSITLEVVSHESGILIRDCQQIASVRFEWMAGKPSHLYKGNYLNQKHGAKLPKYVL